jgi:hypothetical protein
MRYGINTTYFLHNVSWSDRVDNTDREFFIDIAAAMNKICWSPTEIASASVAIYNLSNVILAALFKISAHILYFT